MIPKQIKVIIILAIVLLCLMGLSKGSVYAEGSSVEESESSTTTKLIPVEQQETMWRERGATEAQIELLAQLNRDFMSLRERDASRDEAEVLIEQFNTKMQQVSGADGIQMVASNPNSEAIDAWVSHTANIYQCCPSWTKASASWTMGPSKWFSTFIQTGGTAWDLEGWCINSSCNIIVDTGINGGDWNYHIASGKDIVYHQAGCWQR